MYLDLSDNYTGNKILLDVNVQRCYISISNTYTHRDQHGIQCVGISLAITVLDCCWRTNMSTHM